MMFNGFEPICKSLYFRLAGGTDRLNWRWCLSWKLMMILLSPVAASPATDASLSSVSKPMKEEAQCTNPFLPKMVKNLRTACPTPLSYENQPQMIESAKNHANGLETPAKKEYSLPMNTVDPANNYQKLKDEAIEQCARTLHDFVKQQTILRDQLLKRSEIPPELPAGNFPASQRDGKRFIPAPPERRSLPTSQLSPSSHKRPPRSNSLSTQREKNFRIPVNTATETDLQMIPHIGQTRAKKIILFRAQSGSIDDIKILANILGYQPGCKTVEKIAQYVSFQPAAERRETACDLNPKAANRFSEHISPLSEQKVNVNTANEIELCTLPYIGPVLAKRVLDYRQQHGSIGSMEEFKEIKGFGPNRCAKLTEKICF